MNRREFLATTAAALALPSVGIGADAGPAFAHRGYHLCFMRLPTFGLTGPPSNAGAHDPIPR